MLGALLVAWVVLIREAGVATVGAGSEDGYWMTECSRGLRGGEQTQGNER